MEKGKNIKIDKALFSASPFSLPDDTLNNYNIEEKENSARQLLERIKELNCLYNISHEIESCKTLEALLLKITHHITHSMQFPKEARATITLDKKTYSTQPPPSSDNRFISSDIKVKEEMRGIIKVYYPEGKSFAEEEITSLQAISERIGKAVERLELEQSLTLQKDRLDLLFESMHEAVVVEEKDYRISFMNKAAKEMFGDQTGSLCYQSLMGRDEPCQTCPIDEIINKGHKNFSYCAQFKGGQWLELSASSVKNGDGSQAIIEIARDITENKILESDLKQSEERYRHFLENANDAIISLQTGGTINFFNKKAEEIFGYSRSEIMGKSILHLLPESAREVQAEYLKKFFDTKSFENKGLMLKGTGLRKDGTEFPIESSYIPLEIGEYGVITIMRDITPIKQAEEEKARMEGRLQNKVTELSIMNEIGEVLLSIRELDEILHMILIGATAYQALGFNRAFLFLINQEESMLEGEVATGSLTIEEAYKIWEGLARESHTLKELLQSRLGKLSQEDEPINNLVKKMKIPLREGESIFTQAVYENKSFNITDGIHNSLIDKDFISLLETDAFALVPLVSRGKSLGVLLADNFINKEPIVDEDVERLGAFANHASLAIENSHLYKSSREKVEELSRAYNELRENRDKLLRYERLSAVGNVAARVTHEIRNPLVAIGGFARRILKKDQNREVNRSYVKIIVDEIDRLENTLTDILYFTKPAPPKCDTVSLNEIIKNTLKVLDLELEKNNIFLEKNLGPDLPMLWLDENQIRRVVINLIKNAMQAMPDGGTISNSTICDNQWVRIEIADTGVGISDEDIDRLFDAFFTSKPTGSGLGLTVSAQIINNHGGTIEVQKRKPKGTTFIIKLPVKAPS